MIINSKKIAKKLIIAFAIVINVFSSFSAIISDNDGSAFVTKGEFDVLKDSFNEQIDNYNNSIDSKIDGAIAQYLAGIDKSIPSYNLYDKFVSASGSKPVWLNTLDTGSVSTSGFDMQGLVTIYGNICNNIFCYLGYGGTRSDTQIHVGGNHGQGAYYAAYVWYYWVATDGASTTDLATKGLAKNTSYNATTYPATYGVKTWTEKINAFTAGSGSRWISQKIGNFECLKYFCPTYYVNNSIMFNSYYYFSKLLNDTDKSAYLDNNGKNVSSVILPSYTIDAQPGKTVSVGNKKTATDAASDAYIELTSNVKKATDGKNYLDVFWSIDTDKAIYVYDEGYQGDVSTSSSDYTVPEGTYTDEYYRANGLNVQTNDYPSYTFSYYPIELKDQSVTNGIASYCNNTASSIIGEACYNGGGMPIIETTEDDKKVRITLELTCSSNADCEVIVSDKQFKLGALDAGAKNLATINVTANAASPTTFDISVDTKGRVWLYLKNITDTNPVTINSLKIRDV